MPVLTQDPSGGWIPVVVGSTNYKIDAGIFYNKVDSLYKKTGTDSVFAASNGVKKYVFSASTSEACIQQTTILDLRASAPSTTLNNYVFYIIDENKQGFFRLDISDQSTVDNGATTLVTSNGLRFKRIIDGAVNVKWFGATGKGLNTSISTLGLTFTQAQAIFDHTASKVQLTQSDFSNQSVDWFGLQAAINFCIGQKHARLYIPTGNYVIGKGLVFYQSGSLLSSLIVEGASPAYSSDRQSIITIVTKNSFALGFQQCKGVRVKNLFITGQNPLAALTLYDVIENPSTDWVNGCRDNIMSPYAGIIIDPFFSTTSQPDAAQKYPDFTDLYPTANTGGSTDVIIDNCRVEKFLVGIAFSPHNNPTNGDAMSVDNSWINYCRSAISVGQSQNRSVYVNNLKVWGGVETVFDSQRHSDGTAENVEVDGLQLAGSVKFLCRFASWPNKGLFIRRMHAESLLSLGGCFNTATNYGKLYIDNSWINFASQHVDHGHTIHDALLYYRGSLLKVTNSFIGKYSSTRVPFTVAATEAVFEGCQLDFLVMNVYSLNAPTQTIISNTAYRNCTIANEYFGEDNILYASRAAEAPRAKLFLNNMEWHMTRYRLSTPYKRFARQGRSYPFQDFITFDLPVTTLTGIQSDRTASFTLTPGSVDYDRLALGDYLYSYHTNIVNEMGTKSWFLLGKVSSKDPVSGVIGISYTAKGIDSQTSYQMRVARQEYLIPALIVGDVSSGSNIVSNCVVEEKLNLASSLTTGVTIQSPYFPVGTYIVSATSNTITLSNNATQTMTAAEIIGADWNAVEYGTAPVTYDYVCCNQAYKKNDIIYNTDLTTYPEVAKWVCTRSGLTGSTVPPLFDVVYNPIAETTSTNKSIVIGKERFIASIVINSTSPITLNIGTTSGGTDVVNGMSIGANADIVIPINRYFRNATTLHFSGITGSTQIIVPK